MDDDALLVVSGRLVVGVNDGVRGHTVGVVRLRPGVDGVDAIGVILAARVKHGADEKGEHSAHKISQSQHKSNRYIICEEV